MPDPLPSVPTSIPTVLSSATSGDDARALAAEALSWWEDDRHARDRAALDTVENTPAVENTFENTPENSRTLAVENTRQVSLPPAEDLSREEGGHGPELARDADALMAIVRLRILSINQVAALVFDGASVVVARRRLRRLRSQGWIAVWDRPSRTGAPLRYVYPTSKALRWGYRRAVQLTQGTAAEHIVRQMLPASSRRLTRLADGQEPIWLPHQDEVNKLVLSRVGTMPRAELLWWSAWDCPFPDVLNGLKAPQPDFVLVGTKNGAPYLVFGEHDRSSEDRHRWREKIAAYAAACERAQDLFGFRTFVVEVTVTDPLRRQPRARLHTLVALAAESGAEGYMRVTLAGWAHAFPMGDIWTRLDPTDNVATGMRLSRGEVSETEGVPLCHLRADQNMGHQSSF